jgi:hypothetical protein
MLDVSVRTEIALTLPWMPFHRTVVRQDQISTREKGRWESSALQLSIILIFTVQLNPEHKNRKEKGQLMKLPRYGD